MLSNQRGGIIAPVQRAVHFSFHFQLHDKWASLGVVDIFSKEKRSEVMSRIRGKDTKPEILVRSMLHRLGYRFTVGGPRNKRLPGKPDIVLPKWGTVVFVHGCFWHGHKGCPIFKMPKTRTKFWKEKITGNKERDARDEAALKELGWNVVTIWECELANIKKCEELAKRLPYLIEKRPLEYRLPHGGKDCYA